MEMGCSDPRAGFSLFFRIRKLEASSDGATSGLSKPKTDREPDAEVCSEIPGGQGRVQSQIRALG